MRAGSILYNVSNTTGLQQILNFEGMGKEGKYHKIVK